MKMKYVWKLLDKVYEMGINDGIDHALSLPLKRKEDIDLEVHSIDHKRYREIVDLCIAIREKKFDD